MTGAARVTMQGSWRPWMDSGSTLPVRRFSVSCAMPMDGVGLMQARTMSGMPLVMPPSTPPVLLVSVFTAPFSS